MRPLQHITTPQCELASIGFIFSLSLIEIIEWFGLEGTFKGHLVQPPAVSRDIFNWIRLLRAPSNLALNVSRDGASTTSLG